MERDWQHGRHSKKPLKETMELGDRMGPRPIVAREELEALKKMREGTTH